MSAPPDIVIFLGRLHPVLVHLPIGLVVILFLTEALARWPRFRAANSSNSFLLALAVPLALATAACGWLLSLAGGYEQRLLGWHKWTGIATAALLLVAGILYRCGFKKAYQYCLLVNFVALVVASHFGGSLTHGSDYLARFAPAPLNHWLGAGGPTRSKTPEGAGSAPSRSEAFAALVHPILVDKCVSCHGPDKSKGGLRLDTFAGLLKGGESGPALRPGDAANSEIIRRLLLPPEHDDHMPPDGKPQPSQEDLAVLRWWIDAGAPSAKTLSDLQPPREIAGIISTRLGLKPSADSAGKALPARTAEEVLPAAKALAEQLGIVLEPLAGAQPWLQGNAGIAGTNFGDLQLAGLAEIAQNVRWLDLGGTAITDSGLDALRSMTNLTRLHLERTRITDSGLQALCGLENLEYLNLYGTAVTDAGLEPLGKLTRLKQLYLWGTQVSPEAAKAFAEARTDGTRVRQWLEEIELLKAKIKEQEFMVDLGDTATPSAHTVAIAMNALCPVSGKPIQPGHTTLHEKQLIGFCCEDCKAKFTQNPGPFLARLTSSETTKTGQ